jgi:trehalose/maltose hydrolase-like predicted phosphorylase
MARENLRYATTTVEALRKQEPDAYDALVHKTALDPTEVEAWRSAAENMYVPYDEHIKIIPQDDSVWTEKSGISKIRRAIIILCCYSTIRSTFTESKWSNKRT